MRSIRSRIGSGACLLALLAQMVFYPVAAAAGITVSVRSVDASAFPNVSAIVNVLNPQGLPYNGLTKQQFTVLEDDKVVSAEVKSVVDTQEAIAVALVIDVSGSMNDAGKLDSAKQAASALIDTLTTNDTMAVISFSDTVEPVEGFTSDKARLKAAVTGLKAKGATLLYDAVATSAKLIGVAPQRRKVLIVLTDGEDETSKRYTLDGAVAAARDARAPVFAVGLGKDVKREPLDKLGKDTSGQAFFVDSTDQLKQTFLSFSEQLRRQYQIQYTSSLVTDGKQHALTVRVNVQNDTGEGKGSFTLAAQPTQPAATATATATRTPTATPTPAIIAGPVQTTPVPTARPTATPCAGLGCLFGPQMPLALLLAIILALLLLIGLIAWFLFRFSRPLAMEVNGIVEGARVRRGDVLHITATVTSGRAKQADLLVDDQLCATSSQAPFRFEWDSEDVRDGQHRAVIRATGILGTLEKAFAFTKTDDVTLVESQLKYEVHGVRDGDQVSGEVHLEAVVTRGAATRVELLVDGQTRAERRAAPFAFSWDARGLSDRHQLAIRVYDQRGAMTEKLVNVTVKEGTLLADQQTWHGDEVRDVAPAEQARLQIVFRGQHWQHDLTEQETLIGRKQQDAAGPRGAVLFDDPQRLIHREHARILREADGFWIENLGRKGTKVNGRPISQKQRLVNGDIIEVCDAALKFTVEEQHGALDTLPGTTRTQYA